MANAFDSANYKTKEPDEIIAGDRWMWKRSDLGSDYDKSLYTLKYSLRLEGAGATEIEITASGSGTDYLVEVASATTVAYTVGRYQWQAYIVRDADSERVMVDTGIMTVVANRDAATTDPRSHARRTLDAIEAVIEGRASKDQMGYAINGRSLQRMPIKDLLMFRNDYRREVASEAAAAKLASGNHTARKIQVRFT